MLDDDDRRLRKFSDRLCSRLNVDDIIERKLLAVQRPEVFLKIAIEGGRLMRILPVAQVARLGEQQ